MGPNYISEIGKLVYFDKNGNKGVYYQNHRPNYTRNKIALSLKSNKTLTLGVDLPDILNRFYAKVLYGIQIAAEALG